jgi:hypothetical protein
MSRNTRNDAAMSPKVLITPKVWYQCMDAGTAAVRRPSELRQFRRDGWPKLTVYHIPSFEDCFGWTIFRTRGKAEYTLQTIIWRQMADGQRMQDLMHGRATSAAPEPTLEERISFLQAERFDQHFAALSGIRIPLLVRQPEGLDGETFGVSVPREFGVEWWCHGPPEWADLARWTHDCIKILRETPAA